MVIALAAGHAPLALAQSGAATAAATPIAINIPAQPLGQALNELARQANLQMTFPAAVVAGKRAPAVAGPLTVRQALDGLLAGSGLSATVNENKVLIKRAAPAVAAQAAPTSSVPADAPTMPTVTVTATAEEALRQATGVSLIPAQEIAKQPPANDLSQIVRTMPGVNLTGNSPSGQFGNSRQIDLRGMGPENTLILIDGVPVRARNSARMGRSGERNTRGDSNWVPVEAVERVEVLRSPEAARYGSGAAGGVVNIITRQATDTFSGALNLYTNQPQSDGEQATQRFGFLLAGPLGQQLSFRVYGNANKTEADPLDLNAPFASSPTPPAGREGVRNRDANLQLRWAPDAAQSLALNMGFSRQGNIYAGDRALNAGFAGLNSLAEAGAETNTLIRRTTSLVHRKDWGQRRHSRLTLSLEDTDNTPLREGLTGGSEGLFLRDPANMQQAASVESTSVLRNTLLSGEFNTPWAIADLDQLVTIGFEGSQERLDDPYAVSNANPAIGVPTDRSNRAETETVSVFVESNIAATDNLLLTPGVRLDRNDRFGGNWSPSLNLAWQLTSAVSLKAGIARAFKVPNLYQSNPNYLWETNGNGCR